MQENYTLTRQIDYRIKLAIAYSKSLQRIQLITLNKTILINLN